MIDRRILRICRRTSKQLETWVVMEASESRWIPGLQCVLRLLNGQSPTTPAAAFEGSDIVVDSMRTGASCCYSAVLLLCMHSATSPMHIETRSCSCSSHDSELLSTHGRMWWSPGLAISLDDPMLWNSSSRHYVTRSTHGAATLTLTSVKIFLFYGVQITYKTH